MPDHVLWSQNFSLGAPLYPRVPVYWEAADPYDSLSGYTTVVQGTGSGASLTTSVAVSKANGVLLVEVAFGGVANTISGVTYGGVALTRQVYHETAGRGVSIWTLLNPSVGTANLVVTADAATTVLYSRARCVFGVNLADSIRGTGSDGGTFTTPHSYSPSNIIGGDRIFSVALGASSKLVSVSGHSNEVQYSSSPYYVCFSYKQLSYSGTPDPTVAYSWPSGTCDVSMCGLAFKPNPTGPSQYADLVIAEAADVVGGAATSPNDDWGVGAMRFNVAGGDLTPLDARGHMYVEFDLNFQADALPRAWAPLFYLGGSGYFEVDLSGDDPSSGLHTLYIYVNRALDGSPAPNDDAPERAVVSFSTAELVTGVAKRVRFEWQPGTITLDGGDPVIAADGWWKLYFDGVLIDSESDIRLLFNYFGSDPDEFNRFSRVSFGLYGFAGIYDNLEVGYVTDDPATEFVPEGSFGPLVWVEFDSPDNTVRPWAPVSLPDPPTYYHGYKAPKLLSAGSVSRTLSDEQGQYSSQRFSFSVTDQDGYLRDLLTDQLLINRRVVLRLISDEQRRLLGLPRTVGIGLIRGYTVE